MKFLRKIYSLIKNNKEWIFSGIGVAVAVFILTWIFSDKSPRNRIEIQNFQARVKVAFSGDWSEDRVPTTPGILVLREKKPALIIIVNMKDGKKKGLGLYTTGTCQISEAPYKKAILEYKCEVMQGEWIFGADVNNIKNFSIVSLDLTGIKSNTTVDSMILLETITIEFFINGERKSTYMKSHYKQVKIHDPGTTIRWPLKKENVSHNFLLQWTLVTRAPEQFVR